MLDVLAHSLRIALTCVCLPCVLAHSVRLLLASHAEMLVTEIETSTIETIDFAFRQIENRKASLLEQARTKKKYLAGKRTTRGRFDWRCRGQCGGSGAGIISQSESQDDHNQNNQNHIANQTHSAKNRYSMTGLQSQSSVGSQLWTILIDSET